MKLIGAYQNGNYKVSIFDDGTKVRENDLDYFEAAFPESFDLKITNKCHNNCKFCLKPDVKITLTDGTLKNISDVEPGDCVLSYNISRDVFEIKPVLRTFRRLFNDHLIVIETEEGKKISCTPNHKLYTKNRGYIRADELTTDDVLVLDRY